MENRKWLIKQFLTFFVGKMIKLNTGNNLYHLFLFYFDICTLKARLDFVQVGILLLQKKHPFPW